MKSNRYCFCYIGVLLIAEMARTPLAYAQVNTWTNGTSGLTFKWEDSLSWSLGTPPSSAQTAIFITNAASAAPAFRIRNVNIDTNTVTAGGSNNFLAINKLTVSAPQVGAFSSFNTLVLNNAGTATPFQILNTCTISTRGTISITNSVMRVVGSLLDDGTVLLNTGTIITTNTSAFVGNAGVGQMTMLDGTWQGFAGIVGNAPGSQGTLTVAGGTNALSSFLEVGLNLGATGAVWLTGGEMIITNGVAVVGGTGIGQMTVSNGTWRVEGITVGANSGSQGTLTVWGGTNAVSASLDIGEGANAAGSVWLNGGQLTLTNVATSAVIGDSGVGQMTVSNGTWSAYSVYVGYIGGQGTLTIAGGTNTVTSTFDIARAGATGTVWLNGGLLAITNDVSYIGSFGVGSMTVSNGTWLSQNIVIAYASGSRGTFTVAGGTSITTNLIIGSSSCASTGIVNVVGGNLFVTNSGGNAVLDLESGTLTLSSGTLMVDVLVKTNPCASFTQTGGTLIVGGVTNVFTPLPFQITSIQSDGYSIFIRWQTPGGVTNILQATNGGADGSYNTNFVDISIPLPISSPGTYQYNDVGGATNSPSRYYRFRVAP